MEEEFIDIRGSAARLARSLDKLQSNTTLSSTNKQIIEKFVRDAALGKTLPGRARKKVGPARLHTYITHLTTLILAVKKDLNQVTQEDMEMFIDHLENDRLMGRWKSIAVEDVVMQHSIKFSPRYKFDIKVTIRKFYKYLLGDCKFYPPLVDWIDTYCPDKEIPALSEREVKALIQVCNSLVGRTIIQVLFDGGFRISELMNLRLRHVSFKAIDPERPSTKCFMIRVPFSKTLRRTVVLPMEDSTRLLTLWLQKHPGKPIIHDDGSVSATDSSLQLFPMRATTPGAILHRMGQQALGKRVHPHLMRHTSATYWCTKLPYFQFCKRFGWAMVSRMPQRYIDREGIDDLETARIYERHNNVKLNDAQQRHQEVVLKADHDAGNPSEQTQRGVRPSGHTTTDTLNNQQPPFIPQSGGVTHDTKVSSYEGNAHRRQRQFRDAPGHPGHHHSPEPSQGARVRSQRLR